jgi:glutathione S-transferase
MLREDGFLLTGTLHPLVAHVTYPALGFQHPLQAWDEEVTTAVESALGDAYTEPAGDVRGFVERAKTQAA